MYSLDQLIYDLLNSLLFVKKLTMVFISTREMHVTCYAGCTQWNLEIYKKRKD